MCSLNYIQNCHFKFEKLNVASCIFRLYIKQVDCTEHKMKKGTLPRLFHFMKLKRIEANDCVCA